MRGKRETRGSSPNGKWEMEFVNESTSANTFKQEHWKKGEKEETQTPKHKAHKERKVGHKIKYKVCMTDMMIKGGRRWWWDRGSNSIYFHGCTPTPTKAKESHKAKLAWSVLDG